jgi:hypothetical protein
MVSQRALMLCAGLHAIGTGFIPIPSQRGIRGPSEFQTGRKRLNPHAPSLSYFALGMPM